MKVVNQVFVKDKNFYKGDANFWNKPDRLTDKFYELYHKKNEVQNKQFKEKLANQNLKDQSQDLKKKTIIIQKRKKDSRQQLISRQKERIILQSQASQPMIVSKDLENAAFEISQDPTSNQAFINRNRLRGLLSRQQSGKMDLWNDPNKLKSKPLSWMVTESIIDRENQFGVNLQKRINDEIQAQQIQTQYQKKRHELIRNQVKECNWPKELQQKLLIRPRNALVSNKSLSINNTTPQDDQNLNTKQSSVIDKKEELKKDRKRPCSMYQSQFRNLSMQSDFINLHQYNLFKASDQKLFQEPSLLKQSQLAGKSSSIDNLYLKKVNELYKIPGQDKAQIEEDKKSIKKSSLSKSQFRKNRSFSIFTREQIEQMKINHIPYRNLKYKSQFEQIKMDDPKLKYFEEQKKDVFQDLKAFDKKLKNSEKRKKLKKNCFSLSNYQAVMGSKGNDNDRMLQRQVSGDKVNLQGEMFERLKTSNKVMMLKQGTYLNSSMILSKADLKLKNKV